MVFCCRYIAELALTSKCSAASRRDPPASTNSITRILKSPGYGPRIGQTPPNQCARLAPPAHFGNPDSLRLERAVTQKRQLPLKQHCPVPLHRRCIRQQKTSLLETILCLRPGYVRARLSYPDSQYQTARPSKSSAFYILRFER